MYYLFRSYIIYKKTVDLCSEMSLCDAVDTSGNWIFRNNIPEEKDIE